MNRRAEIPAICLGTRAALSEDQYTSNGNIPPTVWRDACAGYWWNVVIDVNTCLEEIARMKAMKLETVH